MGRARQITKSLLGRVGLQVSRAAPVKAPLHSDEGLGLFAGEAGRFWVPLDAPRDVVADAIRQGGIFEPEIVALAARHIIPGSAAVDAGACFGQMAVIFSRLVGPTGEVHTFEANPFLADIVRRNLDENRVENVVLHERAVHHTSEETLHFPPPDLVRFISHGSFGLDPKLGSGHPVRSLALDDIPTTLPISFVKIDVQGSDLFALQGLRRVCKTARPTIVFEFEQQFQEEFSTSFQDYVDEVGALGYRFTETIYGINYVIQPREPSV